MLAESSAPYLVTPASRSKKSVMNLFEDSSNSLGDFRKELRSKMNERLQTSKVMQQTKSIMDQNLNSMMMTSQFKSHLSQRDTRKKIFVAPPSQVKFTESIKPQFSSRFSIDSLNFSPKQPTLEDLLNGREQTSVVKPVVNGQSAIIQKMRMELEIKKIKQEQEIIAEQKQKNKSPTRREFIVENRKIQEVLSLGKVMELQTFFQKEKNTGQISESYKQELKNTAHLIQLTLGKLRK